jgi:hypothetical protein
MKKRPEQPQSKRSAPDLIPLKLAKGLPPLGGTDGKAETEKMAHFRLFLPDSVWVWYVVEYDPQKRLCFGLVSGPAELLLGDFFLDDLKKWHGPLGMAVERDLHWHPMPIAQCRVEAAAERKQQGLES